MQLDRSPVSSVLERVLRLGSFGGFARMTPAEVTSIAENTVDRYFSAGDEICAEGAPVEAMYYVLEGTVSIRRKGETQQLFEAPSVVGGLGALAETADSQQIVADTNCWTLEMPAAVMADVFEDNFSLLLIVMRALAASFIEARLEAGPAAGFNQTIAEVEPPAKELSFAERLFHIHENVSFAKGRIETLVGLARTARELRLPAGAELWKRGDSSTSWLLLVAGAVHCRTADQEFRFGPGDLVGGLDSLANAPRWYDAAVDRDLVALQLDHEELIDSFEDNVDLAMNVCRRLATFLIAIREENARMKSEQARKARDPGALRP